LALLDAGVDFMKLTFGWKVLGHIFIIELSAETVGKEIFNNN
jgi:hypothetical protein